MENLTKVCSKCKLEQSISNFSRSYKSKKAHITWCKRCNSAYKQRHYANASRGILPPVLESEDGSFIQCQQCSAGNWARFIINGNKFCSKCSIIYTRLYITKIKRCGSCAQEKSLTEFNTDLHCGDGLGNRRKECRNAEKAAFYFKNAEKINKKIREWRLNNLQKSKEVNVASRYKLYPDAYKRLLQEQDNKCAICAKEFTEKFIPHIDHDHACCPGGSMTCGKCTRGLLCHRCNKALGFLDDLIENFENAIGYLKRNNAKRSRQL
jgi:hypothetical protein